MRATSLTSRLNVRPGSSAELLLDVVNTGTVIDGVTARVIGIPDGYASAKPNVLPLFPDAAGQIRMQIGLPPSFPAGTHPMTVELLSRQPDTPPEYVNVDIDVPQSPKFGVQARPEVVRARRTVRFIIEVTNRGNVPLDLDLEIADPARRCAVTVLPAAMTLSPGASAQAVATVRSRYVFLGTDSDRSLAVIVTARPSGADLARDDDDDDSGDEKVLTDRAPITFRQRPLFTRGLLTAVILLAIIAAWAAVFLFGIAKVFESDPYTKAAPASFFAATPEKSATPGHDAAADPDGQKTPAAAPDRAAAPAGALPKAGVLPAGVGGNVSGIVTAASSGEPVGRIQVDALRIRQDGSTVLASSAASQADGTYQLAGLFPGKYLLRLSAPGFATAYYPAAAGEAEAQQIAVTSDSTVGNIDAIVTGQPASITGTVDSGDTAGEVSTTVSARLLQQGDVDPVTIADVNADPGDGSFALGNLPAPGTYELTFRTPGYTTTTVRSFVTGGAERFVPTVILSAGATQLTGTVTDGTEPLGGVTVTTSIDGEEVSTATPTAGRVGEFVFTDLPTPATYVITAAKEGYGQQSQVIDLKPGQPHPELTLVLQPGTGTVVGTVSNTSGTGVGGVTVTVGGMASPPSTTTLTDGSVGTFQLAGVPSPGTYTLVFSMDGYAEQTVPIRLVADETPKPVNVVLAAATGVIRGSVVDGNKAGMSGVTVTATDGQQTWPVATTSATRGSPAGSYLLTDLPPGVYSVTAEYSATETRTARVTVVAGVSVERNFTFSEVN